MATELKEISNSVKGINQSTGQFKQAAAAHNSSISKVVKDISGIFNSQRAQVSGLQHSINENLEAGSRTSTKLDQTNSLLQESISIQNSILSSMRQMVSYFQKNGIGGNSEAAGGGSSILRTLAALGIGAGALEVYKQFGTGNASKGVGESGSASEALEFFQSKGYSKEQAAGIVGNLQAESGKNLRTDSVGDGGKAYGIAQWHPDRQAKFKEVYGKDIRQAGFREQLEFVDWELNNTEKRAGDSIRKASTASEAAHIVDAQYERSSGEHRQQRMNNAEALISGKTLASKSDVGGERLVDNKDKVFKLGGGLTGNESNLQGLNTELQSAVLGALKEYQQITGKTATITSGHRTREEQERVSPTYGIKAAPGTSNHERGAAIDISAEDARTMESLGLLAKYGLHRPMGERDPVHVELARGGTSTMGLDPRTAALRSGGQDIGYGGQSNYGMSMMGPPMMPMGMPMPMSPMMLGRGGMNASLIGGLIGAFSPLLSSIAQPREQEAIYRPSAVGGRNFIPQDTKAEDITAAQYFREDQARTAKMLQQNAAEESARRARAEETASKPREQTTQRTEEQPPQAVQVAATKFNLDEEMNGKGNWATDLLRYYGLNSAIT